jgi:hypothetical protein
MIAEFLKESNANLIIINAAINSGIAVVAENKNPVVPVVTVQQLRNFIKKLETFSNVIPFEESEV